ncbi:DUF1806 family protein, partial [Staphylococcus aureus]
MDLITKDSWLQRLKSVNSHSHGGWVYVQGLTHYEINDNNEFLIAGSNYEGQLA